MFWLPGDEAGRGESEMITGLQALVKSHGVNAMEPGMGSVPVLRRKPDGDDAPMYWNPVDPRYSCAGYAIELPARETAARAALQIGFLQQTFVLVRHQVGLDLRSEIHDHDHHDQQ